MLTKSQSRINKEMDLKKFLLRQRIQTNAILGLLSGRQSFFVDKMSQMTIRESSDFEKTSSDSQLSDWQRDNMDYAKKMSTSKN